MLKRLYIDNFRCFVNFEYTPEDRQLLLGSNGSGKSSLMDAILSLKRFIKGEENPFTQSTRTRWQDKHLQVFEVEAELEGRLLLYRVEIRFAENTRQPSVSLEQLKVSGIVVFELSNGFIRFFPEGSDSMASIPLVTSKSALYLSQLSNPSVRSFVRWMDTVYCFRIDQYPHQMDESADSEEPTPDYELENLAGWYRHLVTEQPDENVLFIASMKEAMPGFQSLRFSKEEDGTKKLRVYFAGPGGGRVNYSVSELSDGQRCLIALYMILHFLVAHGRTVFIDEPDNFIALREVQPWLLAVSEAVEEGRGQLAIISHHPEVLNEWASEYGIRFFREENGHVRLEKFRGDSHGNLENAELIARGWDE